jgi:hypothetical protein
MKPFFGKNTRTILCGLFLSLSLIGLFQPAFSEIYYTSIDVIPDTITFTITNSELEQNQGYYEADRQVTVTSAQHFAKKCFWYVGIRVEEPYLVDSFNPSNRIPISQLHWSKDGVRFNSLSSQWSLVNAYFDDIDHTHTEKLTYRLYTNRTILPAGSFSVRIILDSRLQPLPWYK